MATDSPPVLMIPTGLIHAHTHHPEHDLGDLAHLAASIARYGVRQPLLLVPRTWHTAEPGQPAGNIADTFTVVLGRRRLAAARLTGLDHVPAIIDPTLSALAQRQLMLADALDATHRYAAAT